MSTVLELLRVIEDQMEEKKRKAGNKSSITKVYITQRETTFQKQKEIETRNSAAQKKQKKQKRHASSVEGKGI